MSEEKHDEHQHGKHGATVGKAKEIFGAILHNDELVEEGQIEEDEAASELARPKQSAAADDQVVKRLPPD